MSDSVINPLRQDLSALSHKQQVNLATQILLGEESFEEMQKFLGALNHTDVVVPHSWLLDCLYAISAIATKFELETEKALRRRDVERHRAELLQRDLEELHFDHGSEVEIAEKDEALADAKWAEKYEWLKGYAACVAIERLAGELGMSAVAVIANAPERVRDRLADDYPKLKGVVRQDRFDEWVDSHYRIFKGMWPQEKFYQ